MSLARHQRADSAFCPSVLTLNSVFTDPRTVLPASDEVMGIPVTRMPWRGSRRYPLAPSVLRHVADADLIHVHGVDFFFDYLAATRAIHQKHLVATVHGGFFHTGFLRRAKQAYFHSVTRTSAKAYSSVVAGSENETAAFAPIVAGSKLATIEVGVDAAKFAGCSSPKYTRRIVYFGRFAIHKRITALFPLLSCLRRQSTDWELVVAGLPWGQTVSDLTAAIEVAGVKDAVRIVVRPSDAELGDILRGATYFVCASAYEGFGIAAVEAISAGLIPILSHIPPFEKLVRETGTGVLFDPTDPQDAAGRLLGFEQCAVENLASLRVSLMAAATRYEWAEVAASYARVYRQAGRRGRNKPPPVPTSGHDDAYVAPRAEQGT